MAQQARPTPPAPPVPPILAGGYRLATLYRLTNWNARERFDAYRERLGHPAYFRDPIYGENLTSDGEGLLVDDTDLDGLERALLAGAGADPLEGIRIPWHEDGPGATLRSQEAEFLRKYFADRGYTIWPSSHALVVVEHAYIKMLVTILSAEPASQDPA